MKNHLIPKKEFVALLDRAKRVGDGDGRMEVWFEVADRLLEGWDGASYSFVDAFTPGQAALVCCAQFHRGAEYDFLTSITGTELPERTLKAFELLQADEYAELLKNVASVFPGKKFPKYAEDVMSAVCKQPDDYFEKVGAEFATGKGMKRPLRDYVFDYVTAHPEEFGSQS